MKNNEKPVAHYNGSILRTKENQPKESRITMNNNKSNQNKFQLNSSVCDECCLPMRLYGENFIESYTNGHANTLRCLCDLHAAELMEVSE
jgi:hypothetical protein